MAVQALMRLRGLTNGRIRRNSEPC